MMGHKICFYREIWLIILKLSLLPLLIQSTLISAGKTTVDEENHKPDSLINTISRKMFNIKRVYRYKTHQTAGGKLIASILWGIIPAAVLSVTYTDIKCLKKQFTWNNCYLLCIQEKLLTCHISPNKNLSKLIIAYEEVLGL